VIEQGWSGYSDLAYGKDQTIYLFYEDGAQGGNAYQTASLQLAQFTWPKGL
jgi:hypothetical protein